MIAAYQLAAMHAPVLATTFTLALCAGFAQSPTTSKQLLTLDEFFNAVELHGVRISPDGHGVVIETKRADWEAGRFRSDLWLYRDEGAGTLVALTQSGHDRSPGWSPDGRWIAFLSDRSRSTETDKAADDVKDKAERAAQLYVIPLSGGEAFPVTQGDEEVHAFAWSADSRRIYFATRAPWSKEQKEGYKKEWKDVVQFREAERGDVIKRIEIAEALKCAMRGGVKPCDATSGVSEVASTRLRVKQLEASPDGKRVAFLTETPTERWDSLEAYGIYLVDAAGGHTQKLVQFEAFLESMRWAPDNRHIFFWFTNGSVEGSYQVAQPRVYWANTDGGSISTATRWAAKFAGAINDYAPMPEGGLMVTGELGTEVQIYTERSPQSDFSQRSGRSGTYEHISTALRSTRIAFVHSALQSPAEVYLAETADDLVHARPITSFNQLFSERALPEGKPYRWVADDGVKVEGMLIYPPGQFEAKHLRMLTLIHGGPNAADGNHFEADWYQWAALAATQNWLVFEPNYRGSIGYGDRFALGIVPQIVSKPGRDILEGIDALVKDGIADADHLVIGGYSYGGYVTNWLITQASTRFKAAVTGAGAIEHVVNWGNDDTVLDDIYSLGGYPWEAKQRYDQETAVWQINKVKTPTHIVAGADDIRVYVGESYLLERALQARGVSVKLLIFPGEGHALDKNPWHGKIKVREELKWLENHQ